MAGLGDGKPTDGSKVSKGTSAIANPAPIPMDIEPQEGSAGIDETEVGEFVFQAFGSEESQHNADPKNRKQKKSAENSKQDPSVSESDVEGSKKNNDSQVPKHNRRGGAGKAPKKAASDFLI